MAIKFYLEFDGRRIQLPVNPAELTVSRPGDNESAYVLTLGEVTLLRDPRLSSITIESYFPMYPDSPAVLTKSQFKKPQEYINAINKIRKEKKTTRLTVTDTDVNMLVTIEDFETRLVAMDNDVHYTMTLKEFKKYGVKTWTAPAEDAGTAPQTAEPQAARVNVSGAITVGASVIVNGQLHRDSTGRGPGQIRSNYQGVINFISPGKSHPYHVTTPAGGWLGWVTAGSVTLI